MHVKLTLVLLKYSPLNLFIQHKEIIFKFFEVNVNRTSYRNYQKITIQEPPGSVIAGRMQRQKEAILNGEMVPRIVSIASSQSSQYDCVNIVRREFAIVDIQV